MVFFRIGSVQIFLGKSSAFVVNEELASQLQSHCWGWDWDWNWRSAGV
jgi:hypothetical protein